MSNDLLGFAHRFIPAEDDDQNTLLLLHGTGGDENDLLPLGRMLSESAALLSPRGKVQEHGMPRFFLRLAEGVFDEEDLKYRANELAGFVEEARKEYGLDANKVWAVGLSNGANIAASLLLLHPGFLAGAVLLRAMVPFEPEVRHDLAGTPIYLAAGRSDPIVPREHRKARGAATKCRGGCHPRLAARRSRHRARGDRSRPSLARAGSGMVAPILGVLHIGGSRPWR